MRPISRVVSSLVLAAAVSPVVAANVAIINFNDDVATVNSGWRDFGTTVQVVGNNRVIEEPFSLANSWLTVDGAGYPAIAGGAVVRWNDTAAEVAPTPLRRVRGEQSASPNRLNIQLQGYRRADNTVAAGNMRLLTAIPQSRWNNLTTGTVAFDADSFLQVQIYFQENVTNRIFNWAVQDGDQWYLARNDFGGGFGLKRLDNPNAANWVPFDPTLPNLGGVAVNVVGGSPRTFTNIKAVGMLWEIATVPGLNTAQTAALVSQVQIGNWVVNAVSAGPVTPDYVLGDFNFDGGLDGSDVDPFVLALSDLDTYLADFAEAFAEAYPGVTLDSSVVDIIGDFNTDGGFDGSDVDGFVAALSGGRPGTAAIPEPAALGLLASMGVLIVRRRG